MKNGKIVTFTDCSTDTMKNSLATLRKYKPLTKEEEYTLWERMRDGSAAARERLINANLRFVLSRAKQFDWTGMELEDLFQIGVMGLTEATDRYDASTGNTLISYAVWWIDCELKKAVTNYLKNSAAMNLEDKISSGEDCDLTLLDQLAASCENSADWDIRYDQAFEVMKDRVEREFFAGAANLWADYMQKKELGYTMTDVARKHNVTEERAKELIKKINQSLGPNYKQCG